MEIWFCNEELEISNAGNVGLQREFSHRIKFYGLEESALPLC